MLRPKRIPSWMSSSNRWYSWPISRSPLNNNIATPSFRPVRQDSGRRAEQPSPQLAALQPPFGFANYWPRQAGCQALGYAHNAGQFKLLRLSPAESEEYPAKPGEGGRAPRALPSLAAARLCRESPHTGLTSGGDAISQMLLGPED